MESEASYQLGLSYQKAGDHDEAKQVPESVILYWLSNICVGKKQLRVHKNTAAVAQTKQ